MIWSPEQYSKFEAQRNRPILDLLAQVRTHPVSTAADLGCGPGNSTELLRARYPNANIAAIDSSEDMIRAARARLPEVNFELADVSTWSAEGPFDVILSNAVFQWVPNHETLLPRLIGMLSPEGTLAVQIPDNLAEPAHVLMRKVAARGPWAPKLAGVSEGLPPRHDADWYFQLLSPHASVIDVWRTTYHHPLAGGAGAVVEWFKGTGLRPFIELLDEDERREFLAAYQVELAKAYPNDAVLLPFPRLFIVATAGRDPSCL